MVEVSKLMPPGRSMNWRIGMNVEALVFNQALQQFGVFGTKLATERSGRDDNGIATRGRCMCLRRTD
jgi:hypothetical protein